MYELQHDIASTEKIQGPPAPKCCRYKSLEGVKRKSVMVGLIETGSHSLLEDIAAVAVRQSPAAKCQVTRTHETGEHHNVKYLR